MVAQRKFLVLVASVVVLAGAGMVMLVQRAESQAQISPGLNRTFIYTVKFACVNEVGPATVVGVEAPFEPAAYRTVVNVHNFLDEPVKFQKKAVLARSQDLERGPISDKVTEELKPDEALAIDCIDISELLSGPGQLGDQPIGDGFVVIESDTELDVVAAYTSLFADEEGHRNLELFNKIIFEFEVPPVPDDRPIPPLPVPPGGTGEVVVPVEPGQVADVDKKVRDAVNDDLARQGKPPLPPNVRIKIKSVEFGVGKGVGIGLSAGHSIDIEYIEPKVITEFRGMRSKVRLPIE